MTRNQLTFKIEGVITNATSPQQTGVFENNHNACLCDTVPSHLERSYKEGGNVGQCRKEIAHRQVQQKSAQGASNHRILRSCLMNDKQRMQPGQQ